MEATAARVVVRRSIDRGHPVDYAILQEVVFPGDGGYRYLSGTSLSSPYVACVAALLLSQGRSAARTVAILLATARTPGVGPGVWTPQYGYGIVDAAAAVRASR